MRKILITGGAGFIGSNFIHYLLSRYKDIEVVNLDKLTYAGNLDNLKDVADDPRYRFVKGDICDRKIVSEVISGCELVVHFAAETHVDRSILEAGSFITTDVYGTYVLLEEAKKAGVKRFIHISTDEVYGSVEEGFSREDDPLKPSNPYSASKAGADRLAYSFFVTYHLPVIIVRASNNFGPYQYPEKIIPLFITNAIDDLILPLYGDGKNIRDWLYVEDHCRAIDLLIEKGKEGEVYNVGGGNLLPNIELTRRILAILGKPETLIRYVADRPGHDRRYALDTTKIKKLGWEPAHSFDEALKATVRWYQENEPWWRKIKENSPAFKEFYQRWYGERK